MTYFMKQQNKRRYSEGSVYQRQSDGRWVTKYKPHNAPKPIERTSKTEKEAKAKLKEIKKNEILNLKTWDQNLSVLMYDWLHEFRATDVKPQTFDKIESVLRLHIAPVVGDYKCHQVTSAMLQKLLNDKAKEMGHDALSKVNSFLNRFFLYAHNENSISKNPMINVNMPKKEHCKQIDNPTYFLEIDEVRRIEKAVEIEVQKAWKTDNWGSTVARNGYIILLIINTGLRKGETSGLPWINTLNGQIKIKENLGRIINRDRKEGEKKYKWDYSTPKSDTSDRSLPLSKKARFYLQEIQRIQEHLNYVNKEYVARSPQGNPFSNSTWDKLLKKVCELAQIDKPISPHELRHTFATIFYDQNPNQILTLSKWLGHSNVAQTYTYIHELKGSQERANELIENLIPDIEEEVPAVKENQPTNILSFPTTNLKKCL